MIFIRGFALRAGPMLIQPILHFVPLMRSRLFCQNAKHLPRAFCDDQDEGDDDYDYDDDYDDSGDDDWS